MGFGLDVPRVDPFCCAFPPLSRPFPCIRGRARPNGTDLIPLIARAWATEGWFLGPCPSGGARTAPSASRSGTLGGGVGIGVRV